MTTTNTCTSYNSNTGIWEEDGIELTLCTKYQTYNPECLGNCKDCRYPTTLTFTNGLDELNYIINKQKEERETKMDNKINNLTELALNQYTIIADYCAFSCPTIEHKDCIKCGKCGQYNLLNRLFGLPAQMNIEQTVDYQILRNSITNMLIKKDEVQIMPTTNCRDCKFYDNAYNDMPDTCTINAYQESPCSCFEYYEEDYFQDYKDFNNGQPDYSETYEQIDDSEAEDCCRYYIPETFMPEENQWEPSFCNKYPLEAMHCKGCISKCDQTLHTTKCYEKLLAKRKYAHLDYLTDGYFMKDQKQINFEQRLYMTNWLALGHETEDGIIDPKNIDTSLYNKQFCCRKAMKYAQDTYYRELGY